MNKSNRKRPENKPSGLLHASENETLFAMFAEDIYVLATGVVELLFSTAEINGDWRIEGYGVACLMKDYRSRSYSIQVVDIINKGWLLCQFLHQGFCVDQPHSCLITFQMDRCRAGLKFSDETEAKTFKTSIDKRLKRQNKAQESANQQSRSPQSPYGLTSNRIPSQRESNEQTFQGDGLSSVVTAGQQKPTAKRVKTSTTKKLTKADIGSPTQFEHVVHVEWNADQRLQAESPTTRRIELEPEVQELLRQLEIKTVSKSDRKVIEKVIDEGGGLEQLKNAKRTSADPRRSNSQRRERSSRASDSRSSTSDNKSSGSRTAVRQSAESADQQSRSPQSPYALTSTRIPSLAGSNEQSFSGVFDGAVTASSAKKPKRTIGGENNSGTKILTKADIGDPTQFEHVAHWGWNADQEFQLEAPTTSHIELEDMQELLLQLEINTVSKSDRKIIQRVIDNAGGLEHLRNAKRTGADHNDNQATGQLPESKDLGGIARVPAKELADGRGQIDDSSDDSNDSGDDEWND